MSITEAQLIEPIFIGVTNKTQRVIGLKGYRSRGDSKAAEMREAYLSKGTAHKGSLYTLRQLTRSERVSSMQLSWSPALQCFYISSGRKGLCVSGQFQGLPELFASQY